MSDLYQPTLPFSPRLRLKNSRGLIKRFLASELIANGKAAMTNEHIGYRTTTGRYYLFCYHHAEKTPSMLISSRNGGPFYYHCFGCRVVGSMARLGNIIKTGRYCTKDLSLCCHDGSFILIRTNHGNRTDSEISNIPGAAYCDKCAAPVELCECVEEVPF